MNTWLDYVSRLSIKYGEQRVITLFSSVPSLFTDVIIFPNNSGFRSSLVNIISNIQSKAALQLFISLFYCLPFSFGLNVFCYYYPALLLWISHSAHPNWPVCWNPLAGMWCWCCKMKLSYNVMFQVEKKKVTNITVPSKWVWNRVLRSESYIFLL